MSLNTRFTKNKGTKLHTQPSGDYKIATFFNTIDIPIVHLTSGRQEYISLKNDFFFSTHVLYPYGHQS